MRSPGNAKIELHKFYKALLELHTKNPALGANDSEVTTEWIKTNAEDAVLAYKRQNGGGRGARSLKPLGETPSRIDVNRRESGIGLCGSFLWSVRISRKEADDARSLGLSGAC